MQVVYPCCCGLDVHKKSVTACVLWVEDGGKSRGEEKLRDVYTRFAAVGRLASTMWCNACGPGVHRSVWEAGVEPFGGSVRSVAGECAAHQSGARSEDGSERQ